jgi:hypothetical protein
MRKRRLGHQLAPDIQVPLKYRKLVPRRNLSQLLENFKVLSFAVVSAVFPAFPIRYTVFNRHHEGEVLELYGPHGDKDPFCFVSTMDA